MQILQEMGLKAAGLIKVVVFLVPCATVYFPGIVYLRDSLPPANQGPFYHAAVLQ